jgi:hypothetical protein
MYTTDIPSLEARQKLGELLERVYYQNTQYRIMRKDKPMAWLVSEPFMETVVTLVDHLIETNPVLADTLALTLNEDAKRVLGQGTREKNEGKRLPIESILDD